MCFCREEQFWRKAHCIYRDGICYGLNNIAHCLPKCYFPYFAKNICGQDHMLKGGKVNVVAHHWYIKAFSNFQKVRQTCVIFATNDIGCGLTAHP